MNINVQFVRHTDILCDAPLLTSKPRDEYLFTAEGCSPIKRDCWFWWRDTTGIIRILGGGGARAGIKNHTDIPTIYYLMVKGNRLRSCYDKDQSGAWDLYNQYGNK
jgi:hypothetical protein